MALYCYYKAVPKVKTVSHRSRIIPLTLVAIGFILIANALGPILSYQLKSLRFRESTLVSPVEGYYAIDYDKPDNWFPAAPIALVSPSRVTNYTISIPKLKIEKANVAIGGEDLSQSLIQYPGTALPGQYGNAVIFGHSVLPQFYNPKVYKTIFSTLTGMEKGDEIFVDYDGVLYRYLVTNMVEVKPDDVTVLEQRYDAEYLSLITCVPQGTYLRRLIVRAKLISPKLP